MSTHLRLRQPETLPALAKPVPLSGSLAYHVGGARVIDGFLSATHGRPSGADIAEARRKLTEAEHLCRPPSPRIIGAWCQRLRTLPWAPVDDAATQSALTAICLACAAVLTAVWTAETAALALRTWNRWPSPSQVYELLSGLAQPFWRMLDGLKRVIAMAQWEPSYPSARSAGPTPEEEAHVAEVVAEFVQERSFNDAAQVEVRTGVADAPLSDGPLLAVHERLAAEVSSASATGTALLRANIARAARGE